MIRRVALILSIVGVSWWLFADTARHLWGASRSDSVIRFSHFGSYQDFETWKQVIGEFESAHPNIKIKQEYIPGYGTEYDNKVRRQLLAGVAADVLMVQDESFPHLADKALMDLSSLMSQSVNPGLQQTLHRTAIRSFTHYGKPYAAPLYGGNLLIYLNRRCLQKAAALRGTSIPLPDDDWTIEDFRRLCRELTCDFDGDGQTDQFGLWHPWWGYYLPFIWSMGAEVLDESRTHWRFTGPAAQKALQFYADLLLVDRVCPAPGELGQMRQDIAFLTGKVAMVINGPWFIPFLEESSLCDDYYVAHIPRGLGGRFTRVTWDGIAINNNIPRGRLQAAQKFVLFSSSERAQDIFAGSQRWVPARVACTGSFSTSGVRSGVDKFATSFDYLRVQPITSHWKQLDRAIQKHLRGLLAGELNVEDVLRNLANDPVIKTHFPLQ